MQKTCSVGGMFYWKSFFPGGIFPRRQFWGYIYTYNANLRHDIYVLTLTTGKVLVYHPVPLGTQTIAQVFIKYCLEVMYN